MGQSKELKLIMMLAIIVGVCLVGQLGIQMVTYMGYTLLPEWVARIILNIMFWGSFGLMVSAIIMYSKLGKTKSKELQVIASLGLVVGIAHVGQFAIAGLNFFQETMLPRFILNGILYAIWWTAFFYVLAAVALYRKLGLPF
ncbi:MAG: hypothetical protein ACE5FT_00745 [Candidatus Nanoarchaeia archaeon]